MTSHLAPNIFTAGSARGPADHQHGGLRRNGVGSALAARLI
jgi:hypothetical protein